MLRGVADDGNAAQAAANAVRGLSDLGAVTRDQLAAQLYYGQPLPEQLAKVVSEHDGVIEALRNATAEGWAMNALAIDTDSFTLPDYPKFRDAALLMLGKAVQSTPEQCLQVAADTMRMGQDLVPGGPLEAASVSMRIDSVASPVVAHCAEHAERNALALAAHELSILATHAPAAGGGIELADVLARKKLYELAALFPPAGDDSPLTRLRRRPALLEAFARFDNPTRFRTLGADQYPEARDTWLREQSARARSDLPFLADATSDVDGWLCDDMRGQALLRAMTIGLATLAERAQRGRLPREPLRLDDAALRDPYAGGPMKWRVAQDGSELSVWSVGEDRRDDKGTGEWAEQAPLDVVVRFRLTPLAANDAGRRGGGRQADQAKRAAR